MLNNKGEIMNEETEQEKVTPGYSRREFIKASASRSILQDGLQGNIDPFVGRVVDKLKKLGITEALRAHLRL